MGGPEFLRDHFDRSELNHFHQWCSPQSAEASGPLYRTEEGNLEVQNSREISLGNSQGSPCLAHAAFQTAFQERLVLNKDCLKDVEVPAQP